ncbi:hypothetical protein AOLI_G00285250 [Acnodon oligacanthus]
MHSAWFSVLSHVAEQDESKNISIILECCSYTTRNTQMNTECTYSSGIQLLTTEPSTHVHLHTTVRVQPPSRLRPDGYRGYAPSAELGSASGLRRHGPAQHTHIHL